MTYPLLKKIMPHHVIHDAGIILDSATGHIFYADTFQPMNLDFNLVFVRHGETWGNCGQSTADGKIDEYLVLNGIKNMDNRIFQGNVDTPINQLTPTGQQQAQNAAVLLEDNILASGWIPDVIYHSPLQRARETGLPFVKQNHFENIYFPLEGLREMSFGSWENRRLCDFGPDDPCHSFYRDQNALIKDMGNPKRNRAESFYDVLFRAWHVLYSLNKKHSGSRVILFSHSMFGAACCILTGHGQKVENGDYLAFDGKRANSQYYTIPHAIPFVLRVKPGFVA